MGVLLRDLRFGLRQFAKNPGFTTIAIVTLALGIGANTAIFSVVNAVVLKPLPVAHPGRIVAIHERFTQLGLPSIGVSAPDFADLSRRKDIFESTAVVASQSFNLAGSGQPERLEGMMVSSGFFPLMGVKPIVGRWLTSAEDKPGSNRVVLISEGLWKRDFASDPNVAGKTVRLDGEDYTVAGVMPASFEIPSLKADLWAPLGLTPAQLDPVKERGHEWLYMLGRLQPGVTLAQAQAAMNVTAAQFMRQYPDNFPSHAGFGISAVPLLTDLVGSTAKYLYVLLAAVGLVLLIACANVANLMLVRASVRAKEIALRTALGASRLRVTRQLLTESVLLALFGGALGLWLSVWGVDLLKTIGPKNVPRLSQAGIDGTVLAFTLVAALVTGILFGLAPSFQVSKASLHESLQEGGRAGSAGVASQRLRSLLVIAEVALTLVLLVGGVLMIKSFARLLDVNPGFDPHNVLTLQTSLSPSEYSKPSQIAGFYQELLERVSHLPGVEAAGAVSMLPFTGQVNSGSFRIEGEPLRAGVVLPHADIRGVTPGFFRALGVPLRRGRIFTPADTASAPKVAIIDDVLAKTYWPGQDPIGHSVSMSFAHPEWYIVVGIVGNVRNRGFSAPRKGVLYFAEAQRPDAHMALVIRTASRPTSIAGAARQAVASIDKEQPVFSVKTMEQYMSESVSDRRLSVFLLTLFACLALVLAAIGIYGVISYSVSQRVHEIGIRMALGAQKADVLKMILGNGIKLALIGVGIGFAGALILTRYLSSVLYGLRANDPGTFAVAPLVLIGVALAACYIPARRATQIDPIVALRHE